MALNTSREDKSERSIFERRKSEVVGDVGEVVEVEGNTVLENRLYFFNNFSKSNLINSQTFSL